MFPILDRIARPPLWRRYGGEVTYLRPPDTRDWLHWAELRAESRAFLEPWEPTWPKDALAKDAFRRRLSRYSRDARDDEGYAFLLFRKNDDRLLGGLNLSNVTRGIRQSCSIGYWVGQRYARNGYTSDAVHTAVAFTFDHLRLHRVEAGCVPSNLASAGLLRKSGFQDEGFARQYLNINGRWHDHLLFAMLASDPRP
ncbi:MAG: N-acetyltransferase [Alphaproteobacteria bacterium]|nr:N-acetyltransferase [Alphaproteobacteria bacterium]